MPKMRAPHIALAASLLVAGTWHAEAAEKAIDFVVDGQKVVGTLALPDGASTPPVVLLLHGFTGSRDELEIPAVKEGIFERAARMWADKGFASLRIDFRGSGESEGKFEDTTLDGQVKDALAALDYLAAHGATGTVAITDETITVTVTSATSLQLLRLAGAETANFTATSTVNIVKVELP